jgi:hypothetical protein
VAPRHSVSKEITAHPAGDGCRNRRIEKEPRVNTVPRSGPLDGYGQPERRARLRESSDVRLPSAFVEVYGEKPARLVLQQRVDTNDVAST